eukprot:139302-Rhodomonas_salina.3
MTSTGGPLSEIGTGNLERFRGVPDVDAGAAAAGSGAGGASAGAAAGAAGGAAGACVAPLFSGFVSDFGIASSVTGSLPNGNHVRNRICAFLLAMHDVSVVIARTADESGLDC